MPDPDRPGEDGDHGVRHTANASSFRVIVGILLFLFGAGLGGTGATWALTRAKPLSYVGMLVAPSGALMAMTGLGRLLNPNFFGS